jgi:hypothetical protein
MAFTRPKGTILNTIDITAMADPAGTVQAVYDMISGLRLAYGIHEALKRASIQVNPPKRETSPSALNIWAG